VFQAKVGLLGLDTSAAIPPTSIVEIPSPENAAQIQYCILYAKNMQNNKVFHKVRVRVLISLKSVCGDIRIKDQNIIYEYQI